MLLGTGIATLTIPAAVRIAALKLKDNPLPPVAEPELVLVNGWVLDAADLTQGAGA